MLQQKILKYYPDSTFGKILAWTIILKISSILLPIEFNNNDFRESFKFWHNAILIILLFLFTSTQILSNKSKLQIWAKILLFIPTIAVFLFTTVIVLFLGFCKYEEAGTMYVEKNGSATISTRSLNCGATTDYSYNTYYVRPLTPFFNFIWSYNPETIDKSKWVKPKTLDD